MTNDCMAPQHAFIKPKAAASAFIAGNACVYGDVLISEHASIWFGCVLRGDVQRIVVGARTNIQDGAVVHASTNGPPTVIGTDVTIGHQAVLHGCTIEDHAFIGIGAIVLDRAVIRTHGMLAAGALLPPGKVIAENELWAGNPARFVRMLTANEVEHIQANVHRYLTLAAHYQRGSVPSL
jgi:gamma-carbonic anhydrase